MKRFDFSKNHNICFVCFCLIMIFASILCFSFPVVHAEGEATEGQVTTGDHIPVAIPSQYYSCRHFLPNFDYNFFSNMTCFGEETTPSEYSNFTSDFYADDSENVFLNPDLYDEDLYNGEVIIDVNSVTRAYEGYTYEYDADNNHFSSTHVNDLTLSGFEQNYALTNSNSTLQLWLFKYLEEVDTFKANIAPTNSCGFFYNYGQDPVLNYEFPYVKLNAVRTTVEGISGIYVLKTADYDPMGYPSMFKVGTGPNYDNVAYFGNSGTFINSSCRNHNWTDFSVCNLDSNNYQTVQVPSGNGGNGVELKSEIFGVGGLQVYPVNGNSGSDNENILNKDFIYDTSCMFVSGKSISDCGLNVALDFPEGANISQYSYQLTMSLDTAYTFQSPVNSNAQWYQLLKGYGKSEDNVLPPMSQSISFSGNLSDNLTHNCFTIPCNIFNGSLNAGYNAHLVDMGYQTADFNVNAVNLCSALSYCPTKGTLNLGSIVTSTTASNSSFGLSIPIYKGMVSGEFEPSTFTYTFNMDLYKGSEKITSIPLGCTYNALSGESTPTSNPGYNKDQVNQVVNDYNDTNNFDPSDPDYKDPNGYNNTIDVKPNSGGNSSSNSSAHGGNNSVNVVVNNNPTFNNDVNAKSSSASLGDGIIIPTLIKWIAGGKSSSVDEIESISGVNGWLTVIQGTYSFIPSTVWSALSTCFIACIGILVVAFIISIVIKLIT